MKACDICLEKECKASGGVGSCNCETCAQKDSCPKTTLRPTIRITSKCTQSCSHCCFSCSPSNEHHMSIQTAKQVAAFLVAHEVKIVNLMGGEIFCQSRYETVN